MRMRAIVCWIIWKMLAGKIELYRLEIRSKTLGNIHQEFRGVICIPKENQIRGWLVRNGASVRRAESYFCKQIKIRVRYS